MEKREVSPPPGWRFRAFEIMPGLFIANMLVAPIDFRTLDVDAIVALDDWEFTWSPPVPENAIYLHFPLDDAEVVDPKTREVARFVARLVESGHRVLVHCVQGLNRSALVAARALMFLGRSAEEAIALVRERRGTEEGFGALGNQSFVHWLIEEEGS